MSRAKWQPDERQADALDRVAELHTAAAQADADFRAALAEARDIGVTAVALAERLNLERKQVYRLLGYKDR